MFSFKASLKNFSEWKWQQLERALEEDDLAHLEYLRTKKENSLARTLLRADLKNITPAIADLFINKFTDENWQRWGARAGAREGVLVALLDNAMKAGRADLFDVFFNSGIDLNNDKAQSHAIAHILRARMPQDTTAGLVRQIVQRGIDKVENAQFFAGIAVAEKSPEAFDILVQATGADIHRNNEALLRQAAQAGDGVMARHLVEKHNADISLAITTERTLGNESSWLLLDALRVEINPRETAPPTIENLSAELKLLKEAVRELTAEVRDLRAPALNKPVLKSVAL